jgi:hypothetical protein
VAHSLAVDGLAAAALMIVVSSCSSAASSPGCGTEFFPTAVATASPGEPVPDVCSTSMTIP